MMWRNRELDIYLSQQEFHSRGAAYLRIERAPQKKKRVKVKHTVWRSSKSIPKINNCEGERNEIVSSPGRECEQIKTSDAV